MKFFLFVLLFVPKQECLDRVMRENIAECHDYQGYTYWSGSYENNQVCSKVKEPQPTPKQHIEISVDGSYKNDNCYDVYTSSIPLVGEKPAAMFGTFFSRVSIQSSQLYINDYGTINNAAPKGKKSK